MNLRAVLGWAWDYHLEIVVSATLFIMTVKFCQVMTYYRDAFTDWQAVQMSVWSFFSVAAIICMHNTAISRAAIQKSDACERKGRL